MTNGAGGFLRGVPLGCLGGGPGSEVEAPALRGGNSGAVAGATRGTLDSLALESNADRISAFRSAPRITMREGRELLKWHGPDEDLNVS